MLPNGDKPWKISEYSPITLPRNSSGTRRCMEAFAVAKNITNPIPTPINDMTDSETSDETAKIETKRTKMPIPA